MSERRQLLFDALTHDFPGQRHAARLRPGMYLGSVDFRAVHHMVFEVLDQAFERAIAGTCSEIKILLGSDSTVMLWFDGAGFPINHVSREGVSWLEILIACHHLLPSNPNEYPISVCGGVHGLGISSINALCEWMTVENERDGFLWNQAYEEGEAITPLIRGRALNSGESVGTTITFKPDLEIFRTYSVNDGQDLSFSYSYIAERCLKIQ
jgi:DNA gyrase subunit B